MLISTQIIVENFDWNKFFSKEDIDLDDYYILISDMEEFVKKEWEEKVKEENIPNYLQDIFFLFFRNLDWFEIPKEVIKKYKKLL
jgi:hypothetical protein